MPFYLALNDLAPKEIEIIFSLEGVHIAFFVELAEKG